MLVETELSKYEYHSGLETTVEQKDRKQKDRKTERQEDRKTERKKHRNTEREKVMFEKRYKINLRRVCFVVFAFDK